MRRHKGLIVLAILVLAVLLLYTVSFVVDETKDIVVVKTFGEITRVIRGEDNPGLHFKAPWPFQQIVRYDSRKHVLVSPYSQMSTNEKVNVLVTAYCTWQIEDPERFYRAFQDRNTLEDAEGALRALLNNEMKNVIGNEVMTRLVNTNPEEMALRSIDQDILERVRTQAMKDYGITVTDVGGIEALGLPEKVSEAVVQAMIEERSREINRYRSEGEATAEAIINRATAAKEKILAFAERKAAEIRTQGETRAAESYSKFSEDPEFSMFLRSIESARKTLQDRSVFLLDPTMLPILQWLRETPDLQAFSDWPKPPSNVTQP